MIGYKDSCLICGKTWHLERHHCLYGGMRENAEKYDLTCMLCHRCHKRLHKNGYFDGEVKRAAQRHFEETHSRDEWIKAFGKSYLWEREKQKEDGK